MLPGKGWTILLVDDEAPVRKLISRILKLHDYHVLEAGHGEEALAVSYAFPGDIHILVTDIMMPIMSGHELAIRLADLRPRLGILFISGFAGGVMPDGLASREWADYLAKPFKALELLDKVADLIRKIYGVPPEDGPPPGAASPSPPPGGASP